MKKTYILVVLIAFLFCHFSGIAQEGSASIDTSKVDMDEIVVTGTRSETGIKQLPMSISIISKKQIEERQEQSLLPILTEQVPSFFATSRGVLGYGVAAGASGAMSMRGIGGNSAASVLVLIDGHPQYMGLMGHPVADALQAMNVEKVEIIRGPASVLYGSNAMGGVVNIITRKPNSEGFKNDAKIMYGSFNTLNIEGSSLFNKKKFSSAVSASYNKTDGHRPNIEFEQYTANAKLGYNISTAWKVNADLNLTHFNASNPGTVYAPIEDNDSKISRGLTSFSIENKYKNTTGNLNLFYNWGFHDVNDGYFANLQPKDFHFNSTDQLFGVNWYQSATIFKGNKTTLGVDYLNYGGNAWNNYYNGTTTPVADNSEEEMATYLDTRQNINSVFTVNAGIRYNKHSKSGAIWVPQAGIAAAVNEKSEIRGIVSKGFRNPTIKELYLFIVKNPDLLPEEVMNYELSFSQLIFNDALRYTFNIYYIEGKNIIQTVMVNGRPQNTNIATVENKGVEFDATYSLSRAFSFSGNYSYIKMKYPILAAPEHKAYAGIDFRKKKLNASTGVKYIKGLYTVLKPETKEEFALWNVRGSYKIFKGTDLHKEANVFASIDNILGEQYEINFGYPMPKTTIMCGINYKF